MQYGTFIWNELMTPDVEAAKAFYGAVLGWTYSDMPMQEGQYVLATAPGAAMPSAGIMHWPEGQMGGKDWFAYVSVESMDQAIEKTLSADGQVIRAPWTIPGVGIIAIILDAAGSVIGYLQPEPRG